MNTNPGISEENAKKALGTELYSKISGPATNNTTILNRVRGVGSGLGSAALGVGSTVGDAAKGFGSMLGITGGRRRRRSSKRRSAHKKRTSKKSKKQSRRKSRRSRK